MLAKNLLLATSALAALFIASIGAAAPLAEYDFDGGSFASSVISTQFSASDLMNGASVPLATNGGQGNPAPSLELSFGDVANSLNNSLAADDYYTFSITPNGSNVTFNELTFDFFKTNAAGANVQAVLFSDLDGFNAGDEIGVAQLTGAGESGAFFAQSIDLSSLTAELMDPVTFRLYIHDAGASNQSNEFRLDNIILDGTVEAIPEPTTLVMWSLLGLAFVGVTCRWRQQRAS